MAYWRAKNTLPGINSDSEGNTDTPDGRSGSSPLQSDNVVKAVKASDVSIEDQIANANKMFDGKGITVQPKTKTDPTGSGKQFPGINQLANKAMHNMYSGGGGSYKGYHSFSKLPFSEKQILRDEALSYQNKMNKKNKQTNN